MRERDAGLTLVDVIIGATIVVVLVGLAYPGFKLAEDTISTSGIRDRMERSGDRMMKALVDLLMTCRVNDLAEAPDAPALTLRRLRTGVDLAEIQATNTLPWAGTDVVIRFRGISEVTEAEEGTDLNRDHDRSDRFVLGVLEVDDGERIRLLAGQTRVILGLPNHEGDLDGDGQPDAIFDRDGRSLIMKLFLADREANGRLLISTVTRRLLLRNNQE